MKQRFWWWHAPPPLIASRIYLFSVEILRVIVMPNVISKHWISARTGGRSPVRLGSFRGCQRTWLAGACALLIHAALAAPLATGVPRIGWTSAKIMLRPGSRDTRGYAATVFHRRAYTVDLIDAHSGERSTSQIWFDTNRTGRWVRTLVAQVPDDPDQDGVMTPQIVVVPTSGHVVIAVADHTASGSKLLSFSNQSGSWQPLSLPLDSGPIHDAMAPSLAAHGKTVTIAFNADYVNSADVCGQQEGNIFLSTLTDGSSTWSLPKNVTKDYCKPGLLAVGPRLAYSPTGTLYMLYERSGDPNSLEQLAVRSGTLAAKTEEIIEPSPAAKNWGLISHSPYGFEAIAFDARGVAHVTYITSDGDSATPPRLMYAVRDPGGWRRTVLYQAAKRRANADVVPSATAIATGQTGVTVAFVGTANYPLGGEGSEAVYLMHTTGNGWSSPTNFTDSRHSDSSPILATSTGLMDLFLARDSLEYLYARQLPFPQITESLTGSAGIPPTYAADHTLTLKGSVAPAYRPETVIICLQHRLTAVRWGKCQNTSARTVVAAQSGAFTYRHGPLAAGQYRLRVAVRKTNDHLSGSRSFKFTIR